MQLNKRSPSTSSAKRANVHRLRTHAPSRAMITEVDVVVVGSGIVGLLTARELLQNNLSVALVERREPCAGATGAGQGYIWLAHRDPTSVMWELATQSKAKWHDLVKDKVLHECVEWQDIGSLLLASTTEEAQQLADRQQLLRDAGVHTNFLTSTQLSALEPALSVSDKAAALLLKTDTQINGRRAAFTLLDTCNELGSASGGTFHACMHEAVLGFESSKTNSWTVVTEQRRLHARKGLVLTAGVWTGEMLSQITGEVGWKVMLQPRRGHLLEMSRPIGMQEVVHGMMEMAYTKHYKTAESAVATESENEAVDITFTATTSKAGTLLIGSSREFSGYDTTSSPSIITAIMERAAQFLPDLRKVNHSDISTRVGLRPYAQGGMPMIGPVAGQPGLFVAAGHEGSGLCLGPATAELIKCYILDRDVKMLGASQLLPVERLQQVGGK